MIFDILLTAAVAKISYLIHDKIEKKLTRNWTRNVRLVLFKYQFHHSFFGALFIIIAIFTLSGAVSLICIGYGIGNIWQHKITHNRMNEKGMVFINKVIKDA
jgi:hypothetical protein